LLAAPDIVGAPKRSFSQRAGVIQPRTDLYGESPGENRYCVFKSMAGLLVKDHVVALRINSDFISWTRRDGKLRKEKIAEDEGGRWVGLVFIFDPLSGELCAIIPDGEMQRRRVGATTAVAIRHLARPDARIVGVYGSGFQAEGAVRAIAATLPGCTIRLWSPSRERRYAARSNYRADVFFGRTLAVPQAKDRLFRALSRPNGPPLLFVIGASCPVNRRSCAQASAI
jgi:alanine dehydrogenase